MIKKTIEIKNKLGLHARAAAKFVDEASRYQSSMQVSNGDKAVDGKSIMSIMLLAAAKGSELDITTEGPDEAAAMEGINTLIDNLFDEPE